MAKLDIGWLRVKTNCLETPMLTFDLPVEPYWFDLPRGARVEIRPVTTAVMAAAYAAAQPQLAALREADTTMDPASPAASPLPSWPRCSPATLSPPGRVSATPSASRCRYPPRRSSS